jgi:hypothetical protein
MTTLAPSPRKAAPHLWPAEFLLLHNQFHCFRPDEAAVVLAELEPAVFHCELLSQQLDEIQVLVGCLVAKAGFGLARAGEGGGGGGNRCKGTGFGMG